MTPAPLFTAAAAAYAANCALGTAVATGVLDTSGYRWLHHALYVATATTAAAAASSPAWSRSASARAGWALLPAAVPLAVIPLVPARRRGHVLIALSAAPAFAAAAALARR